MSGGEASKLKPCPCQTLPLAVIVGSSGRPQVTLQCLGMPLATSVLNSLPVKETLSPCTSRPLLGLLLRKLSH